MKTLIRIVLPTAATLVLASGCAAKQVHAETPAAASLQPQESHARTQAIAPNTPTASNIHIAEEILRACNIPDADAYFAFDSSHLTAFDAGPLDAVATCFSRGPLAGRAMRLVGHADPRGASEYNIMLGQSRADAVAIDWRTVVSETAA